MGQTTQSVHKRWRGHIGQSKKPKFLINKALDAYSEFAFDVSEVYVAFDKEGLDAAEIAWIAELDPVYNMTRGGAGSPIKHTPPELCAKRSEAAKRRWANPAWRARILASYPKEARVASGKRLSKCGGGAKRWVGHIKKERAPCDRGAVTKATWENSDIRAKRLKGLHLANQREDVKLKRRAASMGRKMPLDAVMKSAQAKHKAVICIELNKQFESLKAAAEYFKVGRSAITEAIKHGRKVAKMYTLTKVDA